MGEGTEPLFRIPFGDWISDAILWMTVTFENFFQIIRGTLTSIYDGLDWLLITPPFWVVILILAGIAFLAKGWKLATGTAIGLLFIYGVDQWANAMDTLALVAIASFITIALGIPLGILAAKSSVASRILRPILDLMQTMPAFVYLIPTIFIFYTGVVPALIATIVFAIAPGVRFTELGIRQVDREVVEAGQAFGASPWRILRQIEFPLALPTIMAGINQVIMLSLSMVVIAGMVGAGGLGGEVVTALSRINIGLGFEAGMAVVILAVYLDRITGAVGTRSKVSRALAIGKDD